MKRILIGGLGGAVCGAGGAAALLFAMPPSAAPAPPAPSVRADPQVALDRVEIKGLPARAMQLLLARSDKAELPRAIKDAPQALQDLAFANMSERSSRLLREEMEALTTLRRREVERARAGLVRLAKRLADAGEIELSDSDDG